MASFEEDKDYTIEKFIDILGKIKKLYDDNDLEKKVDLLEYRLDKLNRNIIDMRSSLKIVQRRLDRMESEESE